MSDIRKPRRETALQPEVRLNAREVNLRAHKLSTKISERGDRARYVIPGFARFTGLHQPVGTGNIENTDLSAYHLMVVMAVSRHPLIEALFHDTSVTSTSFNPDALVDAGVLKGVKVLDLGCGGLPTLARCARAMGATVYTVDIVSADALKFGKEFFSSEQRQLEVSQHIHLDINRPDAVDILKKTTGGNFDVVSESLANLGGRVVNPWEFQYLPKDFVIKEHDHHGFDIYARKSDAVASVLVKHGGVIIHDMKCADG